MSEQGPLVAVIMGSKSDWETMRHVGETLDGFEVPYECHIVSAHRTPGLMAEFAAAAAGRGLAVIIAGAGGAAHLPGMVAAQTLLPVLGVPVESHALKGIDSLLSIVQMPAGIAVGTLAIGRAGAINAALLAVAILANSRPDLRDKLAQFRDEQTNRVLGTRYLKANSARRNHRYPRQQAVGAHVGAGRSQHGLSRAYPLGRTDALRARRG